MNSSSYRIYNVKTHCVEESSNVVIDEVNVTMEKEKEEVVMKAPNLLNSEEIPKKELEFYKDHLKVMVLGSPLQIVQTRFTLNVLNSHWVFLSWVESKNFKQAKKKESWMMTVQEELNQFKRNEVWTLVPPLQDHPIIGAKWILKNKIDENRNIIKIKAKLVAQGYSQEEEIDYE